MNNKARKVYEAEPSPESKAYMSADDELAQLEARLETAVAEVERVKRAIAAQRTKTGATFNAAMSVARQADAPKAPAVRGRRTP